MNQAVTTLDVKEGYRLWAEVYDAGPNALLALEERVLTPLLPPLIGKRVVDLGCGTGRWLRRLISSGAETAVGVDLSPAMLAHARESGLPGNVVCGRCESLPLRDACADLIVCSFTLGYLSDLRSFAREVARVAAPGATVFISDFHPDAHARGWRRTFRLGRDDFEVRNYVRELADIEHALSDCGLLRNDVLECGFGEPEREVFSAAAKPGLFEIAATAGPAMFVLRFQRAATRNALGRQREQPRALCIRGARVALGPGSTTAADLHIEQGRIRVIGESCGTAARTLDLSGYLLLPGLINAHDHLEFNLFPRLGNGPYRNFLEWAEAIHRPTESPVCEHRALPKFVRLWWGGLKNLVSGVTTVCHHNPYVPGVFDHGFPVRVLKRYGWTHSTALSPDIPGACNSTAADAPFLIHLAEGTDEPSGAEIFELDAMGALGPRTVIIHGVGLDESGHRRLRERGAALVWCPSSNLFTLGVTVARERIETAPRAALGTDSAISGAGDLLDEIRCARDLGVAPDLLYAMVTTAAADVLRLQNGEGTIRRGAIADVIGIRASGEDPAAELCELHLDDIELVLLGGELRMISPELAARWPLPLPPGMGEISIAGVRRLVAAPVAALLSVARASIGPEVRLAGKPVAA